MPVLGLITWYSWTPWSEYEQGSEAVRGIEGGECGLANSRDVSLIRQAIREVYRDRVRPLLANTDHQEKSVRYMTPC